MEVTKQDSRFIWSNGFEIFLIMIEPGLFSWISWPSLFKTQVGQKIRSGHSIDYRMAKCLLSLKRLSQAAGWGRWAVDLENYLT